MPNLVLRAPRHFEDAFDNIRDELDVPRRFPYDVLVEAKEAELAKTERLDQRHLGLVAIDPPGASDLDQAFYAEQSGDGFRLYYAIADVGAFVKPGGLIDAEARKRGTTLYSPDTRTALHPLIISEDRASLLPGGEKPALLWTIDLDEAANPVNWRLERALVQAKAAISYAEAQRLIDDDADPSLTLLSRIGTLRQEREAERGGVSLSLPPQEVVERDGSYALEFGTSLPVEGWNAQISLLTGMVAAQTMADNGLGILRTLPPPDKREIARLRRTATYLGLKWGADTTYAGFVRDLRPTSPERCAFLLQCTRVFRGAGYLAFDGDLPRHAEHGAIASLYAHVTAPLRRLVDRFANELLLSFFADQEPPQWAVEGLEELPSLMGRARQRESSLERAMVDITEAIVLEPSIGQVFDGLVVDLQPKRDKAIVQIADPAIVAHVDVAGRSLAEKVNLRLDEVEVARRRIVFSVV